MPGLSESEIRASPLWGHMVQTLSCLVMEQPSNALEAIVPTSHRVLTGSAVAPKEASAYADTRPQARSDVPVDVLTNTSWAANFAKVMAPPKPKRRPLDGEEEEEPPQEEAEMDDASMNGVLSDTVAEQAVFNEVGEGIPPEEAFRLVVGLKHLMRTHPLASVRFWGKIFGSHSDYYIAETKIDPARVPEADVEEEPEEDEDGSRPVEAVADVLFSYCAKRRHSTPQEEPGSGLNVFVYYAASHTDPTRWTRLPDVMPHQIVAARSIRRAFTGDLEAPVHSHPRFPGTEKHYLRAQIARIHSTCTIAPRDVFLTEGAVPEEEDDEGNALPPPSVVPAYTAIPPLIPQDLPEEDDTEAIQPIQSWFNGYRDDELLQSKNWVHTAPTLLRSGRVTVMAEESLEAGDDADMEEAVNHTELISPFLSELSKDSPLSFPGHSRSSFPAWSFRKGFHNESSMGCTYIARSLLWPGAVTYAVTADGKPGARYQMMYVGTGLKNLQGVDYAPSLPPKRLVEYPEDALVLQRDCTADEELEYAPLPPKPRKRTEGTDDDDGDA